LAQLVILLCVYYTIHDREGCFEIDNDDGDGDDVDGRDDDDNADDERLSK